MPPRCIKCLTTLMPDATVCPKCGRPAPPKSALTQQRDIDATQFIRLASRRALLSRRRVALRRRAAARPCRTPRPLSAGAGSRAGPHLGRPRLCRSHPRPAMVSRRSLFIAVFLGLLAGAFLIFVMVSLTRARRLTVWENKWPQRDYRWGFNFGMLDEFNSNVAKCHMETIIPISPANYARLNCRVPAHIKKQAEAAALLLGQSITQLHRVCLSRKSPGCFRSA